MPACSRARSSAKSSGAAGACSGSSSTTGAPTSAAPRRPAPPRRRPPRRARRAWAGVLRGPRSRPGRGGRATASSTTGRGCARAGTVAQVMADLALDRGDRDRAKVAVPRGLEAVDGLDQADGAGLHAVADGLASARVAACHGPHETHVLLDEAALGSSDAPSTSPRYPPGPTRLGELLTSITVVSSMVAGIETAARWHEMSDGRCLRPVAAHAPAGKRSWPDGRLPHGSGGAGGRGLRSRRRSHGRGHRRPGATGQRERLGTGRQPRRERPGRTGQQRRRERGRRGQRERGQRPGGPANVNVSVRVDSPGDDGAVTQTNTSGAAAARWPGGRRGHGGVERGRGVGSRRDGLPGDRRDTGRVGCPRRDPARGETDDATTPASGTAVSAAAATVPDDDAPRHRSSALRTTGAHRPGRERGGQPGERAGRRERLGRRPERPRRERLRRQHERRRGQRLAGQPRARRGVPDTWTWVWNWTGACLDRAGQRSSRRLNWFQLDVLRCRGPNPRHNGVCDLGAAGARHDARRRGRLARDPRCRRPAAARCGVRAARVPARRVVHRRHGSGPPLSPAAPAAGAVEAQQLFFLPSSQAALRTLLPPESIASRRPRAQKPMRERGRRGGAGGGGSPPARSTPTPPSPPLAPSPPARAVGHQASSSS